MRCDMPLAGGGKRWLGISKRCLSSVVPITRRQRVAVLVAAFLAFSHPSRAGTTALPVTLEAKLLAKMAEYDRNFPARAGDRALVILLVKTHHSDSARVAAEMQMALSRLPSIGGLPHQEIVVSYAGPSALAETCRVQHASIVFFGPGFDDDVRAIRDALGGMNILSVAGVPEYVPQGIVLGFDTISGRPKMLVHLVQARRQGVDFSAEVLKLAQVFR